MPEREKQASDDLAAIPRRNLPALNERNAFFWQAGKDNVLRFYRCKPCGHYIHPAAPICPICHARDVGPEDVSGRATIATFTINRQPWEPGLEAPFVVAIVEIEEQPDVRLTTNIVNCGIEDVYIGMPVKVLFDHREDVWLPLFEPA
ncbi:MAG: OB-fold domain-containing protein [Candidatus Sphingomonas phytovorans]|nr:OB-fold domain-containing protein [Sphingomonas sp.]WEK02233.1 MAG: OB-fold domain-containing protein [Sphingomonas sp.]